MPPGTVVDWYASRDYDFLALTDHGRVTRHEPRHRPILMVPGAEVTAYDERGGTFHHLLALMEQGQAESLERLEVTEPQRLLDKLVGVGATVMLAHPYWLGLSSAELARLEGAVGLEVYNHLCQIERGRGYSESHWDELLLRGRRLWGVAVDDCHWRTMDTGGGWVMVRAPELSVAAILESIRRGDFYATQGPEIYQLQVEPEPGLRPAAEPGPELEPHPERQSPPGRRNVTVRCSPCKKIIFYADRWLGLVVDADETNGELLTTASYQLTGKETYVRVTCVDQAGRKAWSQPVFPEAPAGSEPWPGGQLGR